MRNILLLLLVMFVGSAYAELQKVKETADDIFYIDSTSIKKYGNFRRVWGIDDFRERTVDGFLSLRLQMEIDCKKEQFRIISMYSHSEHMGDGTTALNSDYPEDFHEVAPMTYSESVTQAVCLF